MHTISFSSWWCTQLRPKLNSVFLQKITENGKPVDQTPVGNVVIAAYICWIE